MKYKWLNNDKNQKIIVFFNGWGMDESVVKHLDAEDYDVLMFFDYNDLKTEFNFSLLSTYAQKYLIAWSMGVMTATYFDIDYNKKITINGTLKPIDDNYGIPKRIYDLTLKGFSPKGLEKFVKSMFDTEIPIIQINRKYENQKSELEALVHYQAKQDFRYDKIMISSNDKIIPTKNQVAFWGIQPNIKGGHAPFNSFKKWSEFL